MTPDYPLLRAYSQLSEVDADGILAMHIEEIAVKELVYVIERAIAELLHDHGMAFAVRNKLAAAIVLEKEEE